MHLMIFYPGGVSHGFPLDDSTEEIRKVMTTAATIEEGNGNGKVVYRKKEAANETRTDR